MRRNAWIALAGATAFALTGPLAAQSASGGFAAGQNTSAQAAPAQTTAPATTTAPQTDAAAGDDPEAAPVDTKADANTKAKAGGDPKACSTVIRAGPNQGQTIGKCKTTEKPKTDADTPPKI